MMASIATPAICALEPADGACSHPSARRAWVLDRYHAAMDRAVLIFRIRAARLKARATAVVEALSLLRNVGAQVAAGGPLSAQGGVFWISLPRDAVDQAQSRLPLLGYTEAVDLADPVSEGEASSGDVVRWRRRAHRLVQLYEESPEEARERAPDRRTFALETASGVREIQGYRGDGGPLSRRGLPTYDARMLVNLVSAGDGGTLLDPFAGVGGVVIEALAHGCRVVSCDIDPVLRYGLAALNSRHVLADARRLPIASSVIDAVATEPPYEAKATEAVAVSLRELAHVVRPGGQIAMLCAESQGEPLRREAQAAGLSLVHEDAIDRKGVACAVVVWEQA